MTGRDGKHENDHDEIDGIHAAIQSCLSRIISSVASSQDSVSVCAMLDELGDLCSVHDQAEWEFFTSHGYRHEFDHSAVYIFIDNLYDLLKKGAAPSSVIDMLAAIESIIAADITMDHMDFARIDKDVMYDEPESNLIKLPLGKKYR